MVQDAEGMKRIMSNQLLIFSKAPIIGNYMMTFGVGKSAGSGDASGDDFPESPDSVDIRLGEALAVDISLG